MSTSPASASLAGLVVVSGSALKGEEDIKDGANRKKALPSRASA